MILFSLVQNTQRDTQLSERRFLDKPEVVCVCVCVGQKNTLCPEGQPEL